MRAQAGVGGEERRIEEKRWRRRWGCKGRMRRWKQVV